MLDANNINYTSHDKVIDIKCSLKRPIVIDYNYFTVILEIDENQHKSYYYIFRLRFYSYHSKMYAGIKKI